MNKDLKITKDNIDEIQSLIIESVRYFEEWRIEVDKKVQILQTKYDQQHEIELKTNKIAKKKKANLDETTISAITYNNLRLMVNGFFKYARILLFDTNDPQIFINPLCSNQSTLESFFSAIRRKGFDSVDKYGKGMSMTQWLKTFRKCRDNDITDSLKNNPMYRGTSMSDEVVIEQTTAFDKALGRAVNARQKKMDSCIPQTDIYEGISTNVSVIDSLILEEKSTMIRKHFLDMRIKSFTYAIWEEQSTSQHVGETIYSVMGTRYEAWFDKFCSLSESAPFRLDSFCQRAFTRILLIYELSIEAGSRNSKSSPWLNLMNYLTSKDFVDDRKLLPTEMNIHTPCTLLVFVLFQLFELWINKFIVDLEEKMRESAYEVKNEDLKCSVCNTTNATMYTRCCKHTICDGCQDLNEECPICKSSLDGEVPCVSAEDEKMEVQYYFGSGIKAGIDLQYQRLERCKKKKGNCDEEIKCIMEDIELSKELRVLHDDALQDPDYMEKYYPKYIQVYNRGFFCSSSC